MVKELKEHRRFLSKPNYVNNVSNDCVREIILSSVFDIQRRYDDFVDKGSGWTRQNFRLFDIHITHKSSDELIYIYYGIFLEHF